MRGTDPIKSKWECLILTMYECILHSFKNCLLYYTVLLYFILLNYLFNLHGQILE